MKFCPECGAKLANESTKFCPDCGANINGKAPSKVEAPIYPKPVDLLIEEYEYEVLPDGTYAVIKPKDVYKTKYVIPEGVSVIKSHAFTTSNAELVEEVVLPNSIRIIESLAFSEHKTLKKINFPDGLEEIGDKALKGSQINEIVFPNSIKRLGEGVFERCRLGKVVLPDSINELPKCFFKDCTIENITIPSNIARIGYRAFYDADIKEINFKEGLKGISDVAFCRAWLPKQISLPSTLLIVSGNAFEHTSGLEKIIYDGNLSICVDDSVKVITSKKNKELAERTKKVRDDREKRGAVVWDGVTDSRKCTIKTVGDVTFYIKEGKIIGWESKSNIDKLEIPDGCSWIEEGCFKSKKIKSIVYPRNKTTIEISFDGRLADFHDSGVTQFVIPKEAENVIVNDRFGGTMSLLSRHWEIQEIKFEDSTCWNVEKKIIDDSNEMMNYIYLQKRIFKKNRIKIFFKKLFGG